MILNRTAQRKIVGAAEYKNNNLKIKSNKCCN